MSSSIRLQCAVVQFSLTRLCKQLTEHQRIGDVNADAHHNVVFEQFWHRSESVPFLTKPGILALLRNRLRLCDVTSPGGLAISVGMVFDFRHCSTDRSLFLDSIS